MKQESQEQLLVDKFSGPLLFDYVWWVIQQAQSRKIETLYFLARDGFLLREIAEEICKKKGLSIDCRYFYCSRASLRMPSYHLIGDEAMELLLLRGYNVTLDSFMRRAELTEKESQKVFQECNLLKVDRDRKLSKKEHEEITSKLRQSQLFKQIILQKSRKQYANTIGYMRQEKMLDQAVVAIVDSGWTGSMQRSLRQLLDSAGFTGELVGFYFGMYALPKSKEDGTYLTWMFDHTTGLRTKIEFCNNLFECLLSAPHAMTISYSMQNDRFVPELADDINDEQEKIVSYRINMVMEYVKKRLKTLSSEKIEEKRWRCEDAKRIRRYMAHPTRDEALIYGKYLFCDDVTEAYHFRLADQKQISSLSEYSFFKRLVRYVFNLEKNNRNPELFWTYGTIAFLPHWKQGWYRLNIYGWELARYVLQRN